MLVKPRFIRICSAGLRCFRGALYSPFSSFFKQHNVYKDTARHETSMLDEPMTQTVDRTCGRHGEGGNAFFPVSSPAGSHVLGRMCVVALH